MVSNQFFLGLTGLRFVVFAFQYMTSFGSLVVHAQDATELSQFSFLYKEFQFLRRCLTCLLFDLLG